ncbi:MAG: hypothetical protein HY784_14685, partial [Chloroflexi bacterium]|nr:hypothetical protein [Chloroflexota bacterium]
MLFWIGLSLGFEGLRRVFKPLGALALAGVLLLNGYGLSHVWRVGVQHDDWRAAAGFLRDQATRADVVVVHLSWYRFVFEHYYDRAGRVIAPWGSQIRSEAEVMNGLGGWQEAEVIWLVQSGQERTDPDRLVERWLLARFPEVTEAYPRGITLKGFAVRYRTPTLPLSAVSTSIVYPGGLQLVGYRVPQPRLPVTDYWLHPPSTWVHVTLYWRVAS